MTFSEFFLRFFRLLLFKNIVLIKICFDEKHHDLMDISIEMTGSSNILYIPAMPLQVGYALAKQVALYHL